MFGAGDTIEAQIIRHLALGIQGSGIPEGRVAWGFRAEYTRNPGRLASPKPKP